MKMQKPREIFTADEETTVVVAGEEQTLVAPRFDDEETLVARPVVPLDGADAPEAPTTLNAAAPAARAYAPTRLLPRRAMLFPLMLVSVLIGGVLGGAGLYFYQRQSGEARQPAPAAATSQPENPNTTQNEASQPAPAANEALTMAPGATNADAATDTPPATEANATNASNASSAPADEDRADPDEDGAAHAREAESVPAAGSPKRGKKGERDEEIERSTRRTNRADSAAPIARADADEREARRVDTIFYRQRRAARDRARRQTAGDVDRLRRIFEGSPE
jgi:hypothetical protein